jgi:hypothetical protein
MPIRAALVLLLSFSSVALAEAPYSLKLKKIGSNDVGRNDVRTTTSIHYTVVDQTGKTIHQDRSEDRLRLIYVEKYMKLDNELTMQRHFDKAQRSHGEELEDLPYQGKTVLFQQKKMGGFRFVAEDQELAGADARFLDFDLPQTQKDGSLGAFLPDKPVCVGETWRVDIDRFVTQSSWKIDTAKSRARGKLLRVYERDGRRFGVLEIHAVLPIAEIEWGAEKVVPESGTEMVVDWVYELCIDGTSADMVMKGTSKVAMEAVRSFADQPVRMNYTYEVNYTWARSDVTAK